MEPDLQSEEYVDVVNEHDELIRSMPLLEVRRIGPEVLAQNGEYLRGVCAFIKNGKGQLWIPRRCKYKKVLPLALDMSISGFVSAGETYDQALAREAMEETNIDVQRMPVKHLGLLRPRDGINFFTNVYEVASDEEPEYNSQEFCESYWLHPQELLDMLSKEQSVKNVFVVAVKKFYHPV